MVTAKEFDRIALALPDATSAPHFDRTAYKARVIFASLAPDGMSANLKLSPDEQALKTLTAPEAFIPVPGAWGRQGWTTVMLHRVMADELEAALRLAHAQAGPKPKRRAGRR
jgi:hypothetical protein